MSHQFIKRLQWVGIKLGKSDGCLRILELTNKEKQDTFTKHGGLLGTYNYETPEEKIYGVLNKNYTKG